MNPASIIKLMSAKNKFEENHPKFMAFLKMVFQRPIKEGTVIEVTLTRPGEEPITANLRVTQSDLELFEELKSITK